MAQKKAFLLRLDPATHDALQRWADSEFRSLNAQIEFLLRRALVTAGFLPDRSQTAGGRGGQERDRDTRPSDAEPKH